MDKVERFIKKFIPENYNLFLDINRKEKKFNGQVKIIGNALSENISLHQKDLDIISVKINGENHNFKIDNSNEAVHIESKKLANLEIELEFKGNITDNMTGIYPSYYSIDGVKKELISTQFESHFARQAFPCVDEPEAKATFDLSIKFDQMDGEIVLSNMPEINVDERKKTGIWKFDTSPKMSSYLLAFALGDMQGKTSKTKNGTEVGIFSTKAHPAKSMDFALNIAIKTIEFYEDYFGVKYPIPHSYHVALPDFSAGAMENWGLITYREVFLLVDENSTVSSRQDVAIVIAHEVSHQWFGNLVTMKWWDDLWLNESFANMMEYVSIDNIHPDWNIMESFQLTGVPYALKRDATDGVQSVHVDVSHPDEINSLFDPAIVYAKGSRLMHMLRRWLGDKDFSTGLGNYFDKFKYSNTVGSDLWNELNIASGKDVAGFMETWLEQAGYPVLNVKVENDKLIISQKQFFIGKHEDKNRMWQVPLNSNWKGIPETLSSREIEIPNYSQLEKENKGAFRINTENTAHYIVNYEGELLDNILNEFDSLNKITKLQVLQDLDLLAEAGNISYTEIVPLLALLKDENSYMVNGIGKKLISNLKRFVDQDSEVEKKFKTAIREIFVSKYNRLGFIAKDNETDDDEMVRQITLSMMIYADDENAISEAEKIFDKYKDNLEKIPAPIRAVVLLNQIKHKESDELFDKYIDLYVKTVDSNLKRQLASALSETRSDNTIDKILSVLKDKDIVKPQDLAMSWYGSFLAKEYPQNKFWQWACDNWDWILKTLGGDMSFDKFVIYPAATFKTKEKLDEFKKFFEPQLSNVAISRSISMGINEIEARVKLIEKEKVSVEKAITNL